MNRRHTVSLMGREIPIRTEAASEQVREASLMVSHMVERVREGGAVRDPLQVALLAALNLAGELLVERGQGEQEMDERIEALNRRLSEELERDFPGEPG